MELDELKSLINERMERVQTEKSPADIAMLLGKKTQAVTAKIKRSLVIEMVTSVAFTLACIAIAVFGTYSSLRIYFAIFAVICALFIPLLYILFNKTKKLSSTALPVKSNLQTLIKIIREYVKRYFQLTMALIPISLIIAFSLVYTQENLYNPVQDTFFVGSPLKTALIAGYIILFSIGMYYFTKWYLKKLYGNYVQQLEMLIEELEEQQ